MEAGDCGSLSLILDKIESDKRRTKCLPTVTSSQPIEATGARESTKEHHKVCKYDWMVYYDDKASRFYYYNIKTMQTQWSNPSGWEETIDPKTKRTYYYHQQDNIRQWEKPASYIDFAATQMKSIISNVKEDKVAIVDKLIQSAASSSITSLNIVDNWSSKGLCSDKAGRQMSMYFDLNQLDSNREDAKIRKEKLKRCNVDWNSIKKEKKEMKKKIRLANEHV